MTIATLPILAFWGLPAWAISLAIAGISMGLSLLMARKERSQDPNDNYAWQRQTTQRADLAKERCYGTYPVYGNIIAQHMTVTNSVQSRDNPPAGRPDWLQALLSNPYLAAWLNQGIEAVPAETDPIYTILHSTQQNNILLAYGEGPIEGVLSDPPERINDMDASTLTGVTIVHRRGTSVQTATGQGNITEIVVNREAHDEVDGYVEDTTPDKDFSNLAIVVLMADGLMEYEDDGDRSLNQLGVKVHLRKHADSAWHTLVDHILYARSPNALRMIYYADQTYTGGSALTIEQGYRYDWRVTCTYEDNNGDLEFGTLTVEAIQEIYEDNPVFPGLALTSISAMPSKKLSGSLEYKALAQHRVVRIYDGATWSIAYSCNPAWVAYDRWTEPVITGDGDGTPYAVDHYRGLNPSLIDTDEFKAWADWCKIQRDNGNGGTENQFEFHGRFERPEDRHKSADRVAAMSRARLWRDGRKIRVWIDKSTTPTFIACRSNCSSYKEHSVDARRVPSVIEITADIAANDYESTPIRAVDTTASYHHTERMDGFGMTATSQIRRFGDFVFRKNKYLRLMNEFTGGPEFGDIEPGHVGYCADDCNAKTFSGRIIQPYSTSVLLDQTPSPQAAGRTYSLVLQTFHPTTGRICHRYNNVTLSGAVVTLAGGDSFETPPEIGDVYIYADEANLDLYRVIGRSGTHRHTWSFIGEEYREAFYSGDSDEPVLDTDIELGTVVAVGPGGGRVTRAEIDNQVPDTVTGTPVYAQTPKVTGIVFLGDGVDTVTWTGSGALQYGWIRYQGRVFPIRENLTGTTSRYIYWDPDAADPTQLDSTDDLGAINRAEVFLGCLNVDGAVVEQNWIRVSDYGKTVSQDDVLSGGLFHMILDEDFANPAGDFESRWSLLTPGIVAQYSIQDDAGEDGGSALVVGDSGGVDSGLWVYNRSFPMAQNRLYRMGIKILVNSGYTTFGFGGYGRNSDDTDWVDGAGGNSSSPNDQCFFGGWEREGSSTFAWYYGYVRRTDAVVGDTVRQCDSPHNPGELYNTVRYVRPCFYLNMDAGDGSFDGQQIVDRITFEEIDPTNAKSLPGAKVLTDNYAIPGTDPIGQRYTNYGATKDITILLPEATIDKEYEFHVDAAYDIYVAVQSGNQHLGGTTDQTMKLTGLETYARPGCNVPGIWRNMRKGGTAPTYVTAGGGFIYDVSDSYIYDVNDQPIPDV